MSMLMLDLLTLIFDDDAVCSADDALFDDDAVCSADDALEDAVMEAYVVYDGNDGDDGDDGDDGEPCALPEAA